MAIYTTFFLCEPGELVGGFPGWRLPLPEPVRREFRNPFTGETSVVETREPEWPDEDEGEEPGQDPRVVAIHGSYEDYLEGRLPPFVRACPHWAAKGLTEVELGPLYRAVGVGSDMACPIYGPPSSGAVIQEMPPGLLPKLAALDQDAVAKEWAAAISTPEYTHSVSGTRLSDGWTAGEALELLNPLVALAREATGGQRMYLLVEA